jgi:nitrous oxidase accessory protein NosD
MKEKGEMLKRIVSGIMLTLLLVGTLTLAVNIHSVKSTQEPPAVEWSKRYAGGDPNGGYTVIQTSDGGYTIAGHTEAFGAGSYDFWLIKTDANGNALWNKTYGGTNIDVPRSAIQTTGGGYAIVGTSSSFSGEQNGWVVKTDANGNMQWNKVFGGTGLDDIYSVIQTNDGGYAFAGYTQSFGAGDWDVWFIKTDLNGNEQWSKTYGGSSSDGANQVIQTRDGGYALFCVTWSFAKRMADWWLVKTDVNGNEQWNKTYDGRGWDDRRAFVQTSDGGYAMFGQTAYGECGPDVSFWLVRADENGNKLWDKTYGGTGDEWGGDSLVQTSDEGYAFVGRTNSFGSGGNDFWLVKTDSNGNMQWNETYGGAGDDVGTSMVQTRDGGYALAGYSNSFSGDGSYQVWLIKLAGSGPRTWIVDDDGPADFHTIQEAINAASDGDTIFVRNGTYHENVVVNKTVSLNGENREMTIIDGNNNGDVVDVVANDVNITRFTLQNHGGVWHAVFVESSSSRVTIWNNTMIDNHCGVAVYSGALNVTIRSNLIFNKQPSYADGIRLYISSKALVMDNIVMNESTAIGLDWASDNVVKNNTVMYNYIGIGAGNPSYNNLFFENTISHNSYGFLASLPNSKFFHNNMISNGYQAQSYATLVWDDGFPSGGNYWSDYAGMDANSDGIGDSPYVIDSNNQDNYPLMNPWIPPDVAVTGIALSKTVVGQNFTAHLNVTVTNQGNKIEGFNITAYANTTKIQTQFITLTGGNSTNVTFNWDTTGWTMGNYNISAIATQLPSEIDTTDNTLIGGIIKVTIPGDINGDFYVNIQDAALIGLYWQWRVAIYPPPPLLAEADINGDGIVNIKDAAIIGLNWLQHA